MLDRVQLNREVRRKQSGFGRWVYYQYKIQR
uniref:Uncharacterized protein n=1 Tax=Rhizophora mucronata TaxID=61149 RepID=A0A2P2J4F5_RHIMU